MNKTCKNCGSVKFKTWEELTDDELFLIERLPAKDNFSQDERKKQCFCKRCFYPFEVIDSQTA